MQISHLPGFQDVHQNILNGFPGLLNVIFKKPRVPIIQDLADFEFEIPAIAVTSITQGCNRIAPVHQVGQRSQKSRIHADDIKQ